MNTAANPRHHSGNNPPLRLPATLSAFRTLPRLYKMVSDYTTAPCCLTTGRALLALSVAKDIKEYALCFENCSGLLSTRAPSWLGLQKHELNCGASAGPVQ
ncbi:predicted protein [Pyrenophora tritici-repentis Pt-1C-BFP]|uniref:Uncharacterized protein n=1 Tax=Pyrenophora tritici-repentis (strain Pt-1C-BFP) TaxID=426418 RepID=B2W054_PYRTR|nr:uncharacterized protein PTRG_03044 [Pyrenophora tritici-repentis Pt-1C-BFP]EDU45567.1 predicted protein [Pyrenophora tritici-repentis Pt-1C-BFP]